MKPWSVPKPVNDQKKATGLDLLMSSCCFLLKNVDFEFQFATNPFAQFSSRNTCYEPDSLSRNSEVPKMGLKGLKCLPLHNENQGNGENKPQVEFISFL